MIQNKLEYQVFNFTYNKINFSSLLINELKDFKNPNAKKSYTLTLFKKGTTECMAFDLVKNGGELLIESTMSRDKYRKATAFLEHNASNYDPNNPFTPAIFFSLIDGKSPSNAMSDLLDRKICAKYFPTTSNNEQDKVYFHSFINNDKRGQKRSAENYSKTEKLIPEANKVIGNRNISVGFSADEKYRWNETGKIKEDARRL